MPDSYADIAKQIIESNRYLTLATVLQNGNPWITPLFYAYNLDYTLYFTSPKDSQHIQALENQPKTTAVIFDSRQPDGAYQAVYITGKTRQVPSKDLGTALEIIYKRKMKIGLKVYETIKQSRDFRGESPMRLYAFEPDLMWVLTDPKEDSGHLVYKRVLVELA